MAYRKSPSLLGHGQKLMTQHGLAKDVGNCYIIWYKVFAYSILSEVGSLESEL
jgi:hypothetical protein